MSRVPWMLSCRESARLLTVRHDRALTWREKTALKLHLWVCAACQRFDRQMHFLSQAMRRWRQGLGDDLGK